jgi:cysteinyl-tRNA synthetase
VINLYNTLTRTVETFKPLEPGKVKIYCCGPTVYNYQHIGNLKTYIFEDILVRTLRYFGYEVKHVMNITDVGHLVSDADEGEDKMLVAMKREKKKSYEIAEYYTEAFFKDCQALNIKRPDIVCKATDHIQEMIDLIKRLEANGLTYIKGGNVYFDVEKFPSYGKLALLDLEKLKAGARVEVDSNKRHPADFVLWFTKSKFENQELQWDSPWGRGYPGWHIECSAMAMKYLGEQFDIHCGGIDHIPVHHTNEIAQSEGATGKPWVNFWMHSEFILLNKEKMSKSKGGFLVLSDLVGFEPLDYRFLVLGSHYRSQLNFSEEAMEGARASRNSLKSKAKSMMDSTDIPMLPPEHELLSDFNEAVSSDLNTPLALAKLREILDNESFDVKTRLGALKTADLILGIDVESWFKADEIPESVLKLASDRQAAREKKNWAESDRLRDEIRKLGFNVEDSKSGQKITKC